MTSLAMAAALALPGIALAETAPVITVTGEGRVASAPDMAMISLGVTTEGDTAAAAMAANSAETAKVIANLTGSGIAAADIQTTGLSLNPNWISSSSGENAINGYIASNMVTVRLRKLDGLGIVLDSAVKDGANTLNGIEFGLVDLAPKLAEARKRAVADARARAEQLAGAAGVSLGKITAIVEMPGYSAPMPMMRMAADASAAGVPVAGGELETTAQVTISWEIAN
ncbi:SIMPL domain-containing protein [Gemmobacter sp. JM10B15]|uniref:SIMPL domain-containing protein n=2 Tax=Gemmobacter denitrificans TaxID=3123040 RepID=A0ABU8BS90_9RHOB